MSTERGVNARDDAGQTASGRARKAYYVERPARTVTTILVYADTAAEAVDLAARGEGEAIDSETTNMGRGRARRAPLEDDE